MVREESGLIYVNNLNISINSSIFIRTTTCHINIATIHFMPDTRVQACCSAFLITE
jgi:hypothetical protein